MGPAPLKGRAMLRGKRVLIVEDDFVLAELFRLCLDRAGAVPIGPAASATDALALAAAQPIDGAVLDVSLRDGDSVTVSQALCARGVPVVVVSGHEPEEVPDELRRRPYLAKPVTPDALLDIAERAFAPPRLNV